ncbi:MAG: type II toxin-antitoxin system HicB family antitoxin [Nitrospirota bacterium]
MKLKNYNLQVIIEQDEDGVFIAECPALQACYAQGKTYEEAIENIKDVITMCIEELKQDKKKINLKYPEVIGIKSLEVAV